LLETERAANRHRELTDAQLLAGRERRGRDALRRRDLHHTDVGALVGADHLAGLGAAVGEPHGDGALSLDDVRGGEDVTVGVVDDAGTETVADVDLYDRARYSSGRGLRRLVRGAGVARILHCDTIRTGLRADDRRRVDGVATEREAGRRDGEDRE